VGFIFADEPFDGCPFAEHHDVLLGSGEKRWAKQQATAQQENYFHREKLNIAVRQNARTDEHSAVEIPEAGTDAEFLNLY
jgi:hypothetical protein